MGVGGSIELDKYETHDVHSKIKKKNMKQLTKLKNIELVLLEDNETVKKKKYFNLIKLLKISNYEKIRLRNNYINHQL